MLNGEQIAYIETLRKDYPNLNESTLRETLLGASWSEEEITDAIARYKGGEKAPEVTPKPEPIKQTGPTLSETQQPKVVSGFSQSSVTPVAKVEQSPKNVTSSTQTILTTPATPSKFTQSSVVTQPVSQKVNSPTVGATGFTASNTSVSGFAKENVSSTPQAQVTPESSKTTPTPEQKVSTEKPVTAPPVIAQQTLPTSSLKDEPVKTGSLLKKALISLGILLGFGALAAGGYYIATKTNIFTPHKLTNENIFSTIFTKLGEIERTSYGVSLLVKTNQRAEGAVPFGNTETLTEEELAQYKRDQDRIRDILKIKAALNQSRISANYEYTKPYPATLSLS